MISSQKTPLYYFDLLQMYISQIICQEDFEESMAILKLEALGQATQHLIRMVKLFELSGIASIERVKVKHRRTDLKKEENFESEQTFFKEHQLPTEE